MRSVLPMTRNGDVKTTRVMCGIAAGLLDLAPRGWTAPARLFDSILCAARETEALLQEPG